MIAASPRAGARAGGRFGIGQPARRSEDLRFLTGVGTYVDDIALPGEAFGHVLRAPFAAAAITRLDVTAARALPGVVAVITARELAEWNVGTLPCVIDLVNRDGSAPRWPDHPVLAIDKVRFAGEPVAFIVAETTSLARDAAEAVEIDYDMADAVTETARADAEGQPLVHGSNPRNIAFDWHHGDAEATRRAFDRAAAIVRLDLVNNRVAACPIETRGAIAEWNPQAGASTLRANTQGGWSIRDHLARRFLHIAPEKVRVITPDVGGGFGIKAFIYPEHVLCALAARALCRPVKWTADRSESFLADTMGRDHVTRAELALDADDRILALRVAVRANMGAYLSEFAPFIPTEGAVKILTGVYDIPVVSYRATGVFTNTVPVDAYRGAGRPESIYMIERLVDRAARERGHDPAAFRRANMIGPSAMPYLTATGERYDTGDFPRILDHALVRADAAGFPARRAASERRGRRRGLGLACYVESTMGEEIEYADIRFDGAAGVSVAVGTQSGGQGHETAYAQVLAARLGVDPAAITVLQGDTDLIFWGGGTGGSRSLTIEAAAINEAGDQVISKARALAADDFEVSRDDVAFAGGDLVVAGTDLRVNLMVLAARHPGALDARARAELEAWTFPNGCHLAEVEVDPETGAARIAAYTVVDDFGLVVNPLLVEGQVIGGVVQGIGQALMEEARFDAAGQLLSGSFMDYALARARGLPAFDFSYIEIPSTNNAMGIKGCGEAGAIAAPAAVINAIIDALWTGPGAPLPDLDMPATPSAIWAALRR